MAYRVGVVGAAGYAGIELVRLLLGHPQFKLVAITSNADAGQKLADVYPAGEDPIPGAGGRDLARVLRLNGCDGLVFCDSASEMPQAVRSIVEDGDVVLTMGAGNVARVPQVLSGKII